MFKDSIFSGQKQDGKGKGFEINTFVGWSGCDRSSPMGLWAPRFQWEAKVRHIYCNCEFYVEVIVGDMKRNWTLIYSEYASC